MPSEAVAMLTAGGMTCSTLIVSAVARNLEKKSGWISSTQKKTVDDPFLQNFLGNLSNPFCQGKTRLTISMFKEVRSTELSVSLTYILGSQ
jgi:hypothetical protein